MSSTLTKVRTPVPGVVVKVAVAAGDAVAVGDAVVIVSAMKLETVIRASESGIVRNLLVKDGQKIEKGEVLFIFEKGATGGNEEPTSIENIESGQRKSLSDLQIRKAFLADRSRPAAYNKRKEKGKNTARENVAKLCDVDSFIEYGGLAIAAQRSRRSEKDLMTHTPADGIITGIGTVNADHFGQDQSRCMVLAYDYTVLAGTQGFMGHKKTDRMLQLAGQLNLPIVFLTEGGGGRPGDTDFQGVGGLDVKTFYLFAKLSGQVPRIAVVGGYCFAGNASLTGSADVIIATRDSAIGMGGPAMIEGGGLGQFHPSQIGPSGVQASNGVIDILVTDEEEALSVAKKYLSYFQGAIGSWSCGDQAALRAMVPENRRRTYDMHSVLTTVADSGSFLELRMSFAKNMITGLARVEGRAIGLIANDPNHLGGAIDSDAADKASRFMQLCDAFDLPIVLFCDTPGIMVGPDSEETGAVRHANRLFVTGAALEVPIFTVVTRRAYGLGSMAMAGGSFHIPVFTVSWPTGEFGGMGLEGAVRLGYRKELEAAANDAERKKLYDQLVREAYDRGKATNTAAFLEIDDVIDPADTRNWLITGLQSVSGKQVSKGNRFIDTW